MLLCRVDVRRAVLREVFRCALERLELDRLCVVERLRLEVCARLVEPEREALDRFTLELERAERLPPLAPRR